MKARHSVNATVIDENLSEAVIPVYILHYMVSPSVDSLNPLKIPTNAREIQGGEYVMVYFESAIPDERTRVVMRVDPTRNQLQPITRPERSTDPLPSATTGTFHRYPLAQQKRHNVTLECKTCVELGIPKILNYITNPERLKLCMIVEDLVLRYMNAFGLLDDNLNCHWHVTNVFKEYIDGLLKRFGTSGLNNADDLKTKWDGVCDKISTLSNEYMHAAAYLGLALLKNPGTFLHVPKFRPEIDDARWKIAVAQYIGAYLILYASPFKPEPQYGTGLGIGVNQAKRANGDLYCGPKTILPGLTGTPVYLRLKEYEFLKDMEKKEEKTNSHVKQLTDNKAEYSDQLMPFHMPSQTKFKPSNYRTKFLTFGPIRLMNGSDYDKNNAQITHLSTEDYKVIRVGQSDSAVRITSPLLIPYGWEEEADL
jgi:hypothetical protein